MLAKVNSIEFKVERNRLNQLRFQSQGEMNSIDVDAVCIASGAWSGQLVKSLGLSLPMVPVRGQIVLFKLEEQLFEPTTYEGARYIVARADGHVVVGATVEEVGFDSSTTDSELQELRRFAASIYPALSDDAYVKGWAGLRPATYDGFPYIGRLPNLENAFVAAGHFRSGLHLSTGTAAVIGDLIVGKQPEVNLNPFDPGRIALVSQLNENQLDIETR
jgi:glycine oxidase